jgi:gliding motility-associated-like protein
MILKKLKTYNPFCKAKKIALGIIIVLLPTLLYPQGTQDLNIYKMIDPDSPLPDSLFTIDIINYIRDTLFLGGAKISDINYIGNAKGVGLFKDGVDIGIDEGLVLCNGWVGTAVTIDGGENKTGAQAIPSLDSLGPYRAEPNGPPPLQDDDMDWLAGMFTPNDPKPDTAYDPSIITFKFRPYYNSIKLQYVFASEEYKYQLPPVPDLPPPPIDVDMTGADVSDFMAIFIKKYPSQQTYDMIASMIGQDGDPSWVPVCVKTRNHNSPPGYYQPNYNRSFMYDGSVLPEQIRPFVTEGTDVIPCQNYWIKIAVADYPHGVVMEHDISHQINSAVFLKAYSLMSGYGLEWTVTGAVDNPDFAGDSTLVEGGCSNIIMTVKFNTMPKDTMFIRFKINNASLSDYTINPPDAVVQDSLIMIPDSITEFTFTINAVDDNIAEGTNGVDNWFIRYQENPCDVPYEDTTGIGSNEDGYSGKIKVKVLDYDPFVNTSKTYGPDMPPPASQYHCGGDVTVSISDILDGGIPPYTYSWSNPPQIANTETFTTTIGASPDVAICRIFDRCTGFPGYANGSDTVYIKSRLEIEASNDFQLCQNGQSDIEIVSTNVGDDYTTIWYFENPPGNLTPVGNESVYTVTWEDYGSYAPNTITFICAATDECGNTANDTVHATFFPVVEISGVPLICLYDQIQLSCTFALDYEWHYGSLGGPIIGDDPVLFYTPTVAGFHTICVRIENECHEYADTCFTFEVSELIMDMTMNNSTNFNTCPNVPFTLKELYAYDGWEWSWEDNGTNYSETGQNISLELTEAGTHPVTVIAYNIHGCYDTITRYVTVFPYAYPVASTSIASVCIDYPTDISIVPTGPVSITNYYWTAVPPDASLAGQQSEPAPTVTPQVTTTYKCRITDNHGCLDSATVEVNVRPRLAGNILGDPGFQCTDKPVTIEFQPIVTPLPNATYYWTFDDGVPATSTLATPPQIVWSTDGLKDISLHIEELGCEETFTFQYQVYPDPLADFSASGAEGCQPIVVSFHDESSNLSGPSYLWDFGDGTTSTDAQPTHLYEIPGAYDITLTVTNSTGCINTRTYDNMVNVFEVPVADFEADPQAATIDNPTINFTELVNIPYSIINWDFGDGATDPGSATPRHTYSLPGTYYVVMYTETEHGCWDRDTLEIGIVEDIKIFVPNAFSPNGDGLNDCFSIGGTTGDIVDVFRLIIYSRWGQQIVDTPVSNPDCLWDGRDVNGNEVMGGQYIFRIFGQNLRGAKKVYEGMVTVLK